MSKIYCIGKFQFDSYDKYQEALEDIEKIRYISKKMDINEPGVAQRLYTLIREGKIIFKSVVFPQPERPISVTNSPLPMDRST